MSKVYSTNNKNISDINVYGKNKAQHIFFKEQYIAIFCLKNDKNETFAQI